ncbi:MAG: hypothetical protein KJZ86_01570 [Caldilineaceae bacterium]|nr:hypothetical protein [Caldilineaceae bacterium]HRJ45162.1 hypothetical protein [Caldilineaceae bacterium]
MLYRSQGRLSGFVSGLGAASADGVYGLVAALGLTWISSFLVDQQPATSPPISPVL